MLSSCLSLSSSDANRIRPHVQFGLVLFGRSKCDTFSMLVERKLSLKTPKIGKCKAKFSLSFWHITARIFVLNTSNKYDAKNLGQYNKICRTQSKTVHTTGSDCSPSVSWGFVYNYQRFLCKVLYLLWITNLNVVLVVCVFTKRF